MGHKHLQPFTFEEPVDRMCVAEIEVVAISRHPYKRLEGGNLLRQFHTSAEITGVPYLVHRLKEITELLVEHTVGI
jgi:hypothetical protein